MHFCIFHCIFLLLDLHFHIFTFIYADIITQVCGMAFFFLIRNFGCTISNIQKVRKETVSHRQHQKVVTEVSPLGKSQLSERRKCVLFTAESLTSTTELMVDLPLMTTGTKISWSNPKLRIKKWLYYRSHLFRGNSLVTYAKSAW